LKLKLQKMTVAHRTHNRGKGPDPRPQISMHLQANINNASFTNQDEVEEFRVKSDVRRMRMERKRSGFLPFLTFTIFLMSAAQLISLTNGKYFVFPCIFYTNFT
jgi:hypothetical protein